MRRPDHIGEVGQVNPRGCFAACFCCWHCSQSCLFDSQESEAIIHKVFPKVNLFDTQNDTSLTTHACVQAKLAITDVRSLKCTVGDFLFVVGGNTAKKLSEQLDQNALIRTPVFVIEVRSKPKTVNQAIMQWFLTVHILVSRFVSFCIQDLIRVDRIRVRVGTSR